METNGDVVSAENCSSNITDHAGVEQCRTPAPRSGWFEEAMSAHESKREKLSTTGSREFQCLMLGFVFADVAHMRRYMKKPETTHQALYDRSLSDGFLLVLGEGGDYRGKCLFSTKKLRVIKKDGHIISFSNF